MGTIMIGTSGYSYRDWGGIFYPENLKPGDYLSWYATIFTFTELNFSYYRQPSKDTVGTMVNSVPDSFRFSIKAHRSLTHEVTDGWRKDLLEFREGIEPLADSGKLSGILLQFPYGFHYTRENRKYLSLLTAEMHDLPLFIEFRNSDWEKESVYDELKSRDIATVAVDQPELPGLPSRLPPRTSEKAYLRFHGRNAKEWWSGDNVSRYDYLYSPEELRDWVPAIQDMASGTTILIIAFNNHHKGKGPQNALQLKALLSGGLHQVI